MKHTIEISAYTQDFGEHVVNRLLEIDRSSDWGGNFWMRNVPVTDPRVKKVQRALEQFGLIPWSGTHPRIRDKEYSVSYSRQYSHFDIKGCDFIRLTPDGYVECSERDDEGRLQIIFPSSGLSRKPGITDATVDSAFVVLDSIRRFMEKEKFRNISFRETVCIDDRDGYGERVSWDDFDGSDTWWEIRTDLILPPLSPKMIIQRINTPPKGPGHLERVKPGSYGGMVRLSDPDCPECTTTELHYRREDIEDVAPFDFAHTYEHSGSHWTVVSQRFYQFCRDNKIKADWTPVRIDED